MDELEDYTEQDEELENSQYCTTWLDRNELQEQMMLDDRERAHDMNQSLRGFW